MNTQQRFYRIIGEISGKQNMELNESIDLLEDLQFDSIQFIELIVEIEKEFDIVFNDDDLDLDKLSKIKNILDILNYKMESK